MFSSRVFLLLLSTAALFSYTSAACTRSCGKSTESVPYPFGFSDECPIQLNCSGDGKFYFRGLKVRNLTSRSLWLDLPSSCNRSISKARDFFGNLYAMTALNTLLVQNCTTNNTANFCLPSLSSFSTRLGAEVGQCKGPEISCFSAKNYDDNVSYPLLLTRELIDTIDCGTLFSSSTLIAADSIELRTVELSWWFEGNCSSSPCHQNANCESLPRKSLLPENITQVKDTISCKCRDGFLGDGFREGSGCRKGNTQPTVQLFILLCLLMRCCLMCRVRRLGILAQEGGQNRSPGRR